MKNEEKNKRKGKRWRGEKRLMEEREMITPKRMNKENRLREVR